MSSQKGIQITAFTSKSNNGLANQLTTEVEIILPNTNAKTKIRAIWDTGATASVITQEVVNTLGLKPSGMVNVNTAAGPTIQSTYIVNFILPNKLIVRDVTVTGAPILSSGCHALIGMDIIGLGDFSVTNHKGKTCMSFRFPSCHELDYVKDLKHGIKPDRQIPAGKPGSNFTKPKKKRRH